MTKIQEDITFIFSPGTGCYYPQLSKYCNHVQFASPFASQSQSPTSETLVDSTTNTSSNLTTNTEANQTVTLTSGLIDLSINGPNGDNSGTHNRDKLVKLQHPRCCPVIGKDHYCVQYPEIDIETPFTSPLHYMLIRHLSLWQGKYTPHPLYCNFVRMRRFNLSQTGDIQAFDNTYQLYVNSIKNSNNTVAINNNNLNTCNNNINTNSTVIMNNISSNVTGNGINGKDKKKPLILYGSSRGASTIITWYSTNKDNRQVTGLIDAIVLEGCPTSIDDIYEYEPNWVNFCRKLLLSSFTQYSNTGVKPIDCVLDLPTDIPIYFIASVKDEVVPYECTEKMVKLLRDHNYTNVRLITLKEAPHSGYMTHNSEDRLAYYSALQELYKYVLKR